MIKQAVTAGILFCLMVRVEGNCGKLNLTKQAEEYVSKRGGEVEKISFTDSHGTSDWEPTTVTVGDMQLEKNCKYKTKLKNSKCVVLYWWYMTCSLLTPFNFTTNVSVPYMDKERRNLTFELNNTTFVQWNLDSLTNETYTQATTDSKSCNFSVEVGFQGKFFYEIQRQRGDNPKKNNVDVIYLEDRGLGLIRKGSSLYYNVTGHFKHEVVCTDQNVQKKLPQKEVAKRRSRKRSLSKTPDARILP
uniref:Putative da-p36 protein n=1 Tax=Rhipicephalus pulchellus TaxID=72859 RepID=L7LQI1_RHIPC